MQEGRYGYVIEVVDRFGKPLSALSRWADAAKEKLYGLNTTLQKPTAAPIEKTSRSVAQLKANIDRYRKAAEESFRPDHIKRYNGLIAETEKRIRSLQGTTEKQGTSGLFGKLQGNFGIGPGMVGGALAVGAGAGLFAKGSEAIDAAAQMEKYQVTLKTMLGTTTAARDRMAEYVDIAKKTPFELNQVVELGNGLQALGRYSKDNVNMIGDLAAASGKPVEQALGAFAKMATGQKGIAVDMFRDLLITTDDWTKATGKGVSKNGELLATTEEMIAALPGIMKGKGFLGMMANQAETTDGKVSNLKDGVNGLKVAVGERLKPSYDAMVVSASKAVDTMTKWVQIPTVQKIAAEKAELNSLVSVLTDHNASQDTRKSVIEQIQQKYPEFLKNINIEKASYEDIRKELEKINVEYDKRMRKASYQTKMEAIENEMKGVMNDVTAYQQSIYANEELNKLLPKAKAALGGSLVRTRRDAEGGTVTSQMTIPEIVKELRFRASNSKITPQGSATLEMLAGDLISNYEETTYFGNDKKRRDKAQKEWDRLNRKKNNIQKIIDKEFGPESSSPLLDKGGNSTPSTGGGKASKELEKASDVISGGGRSVKNFNIRIDSLIGENTNMFSSSEDDPATASAFMQRLSDALQSVVNDTNYAAS